jgi:PAS domain S-box-containing protein
MEHDKIREIKKDFYKLIATHEQIGFEHFVMDLKDRAVLLAETLSSHFYKENNILFPTGLKVITENEWPDIRKEFDELGYCSFTPEAAKIAVDTAEKPALQPEIKGMVAFETGNLVYEEVESIFNALPVDVTFVDKEDTVRYFSETKERIFPRTKAVIGRKVQQCHPQKSLHVVNQILDDFKNGRKEVAEFWINVNGRFIHIRYFPVRNKSGDYLGCLEVTQDITDIKKIEGEKRLL